HLNPIACTEDALANLVEHAQQVMAACHKPLLLENITTHLQVPGSIAETDFINRLCEQSGCGMLLDVTNLYVNSRNHGFDALQWLHEIEPHYIRQLHLVGYNKQGDTWYDSHAENIQQELYELTRTVMAYSNVEAIIIERDNNFPTTQQMQQELCNLEQCCIANQLH
ncbi:MAG: DUF692 domain-containing protein, partial [Gammaproteobacteria bacterium]|nr:DUF692 domain-containing protein [Gammaproteobacteria bacterium]